MRQTGGRQCTAARMQRAIGAWMHQVCSVAKTPHSQTISVEPRCLRLRRRIAFVCSCSNFSPRFAALLGASRAFFCASFGNQFAQELQSLWPKRGRKDIEPVALPPGRFRLFTRPSFTGSLTKTLRKKLPATVIHPSHGHCRAPGRLALGPRGRGHFWKNSLSVQRRGSLITVWLEVRVLPGPPPIFFSIDFICFSLFSPAPGPQVRE